MPRSVRRCLGECVRLLGENWENSPGLSRTRAALADVLHVVGATDWAAYAQQPRRPEVAVEGGVEPIDPSRIQSLVDMLEEVMERTHGIHDVIADGFINHQILLD
jgi:hypothetical protein